MFARMLRATFWKVRLLVDELKTETNALARSDSTISLVHQTARPKAQKKCVSMFSLSVSLHKHTDNVCVLHMPFPIFVLSPAVLLRLFLVLERCPMIKSISCLPVEHHTEAQHSFTHRHLEFHKKSRPFFVSRHFHPVFLSKMLNELHNTKKTGSQNNFGLGPLGKLFLFQRTWYASREVMWGSVSMFVSWICSWQVDSHCLRIPMKVIWGR